MYVKDNVCAYACNIYRVNGQKFNLGLRCRIVQTALAFIAAACAVTCRWSVPRIASKSQYLHM